VFGRWLTAAVEEPQPLPGKEGVLGVFKWPWSEASDSAFVGFQLVPAPLSVSPSASHASNESIENIEEYSSFFEDYDEMSSDDDFDESTLWEIASLLQPNGTVNRDFTSPTSEIVAEYDVYGDANEEILEDAFIDEQTQPTALWSKGKNINEKSSKLGLATPDVQLWNSYLTVDNRFKHSKPRIEQKEPHFVSEELWKQTRDAKTSTRAAVDKKALWNSPNAPSVGSRTSKHQVGAKLADIAAAAKAAKPQEFLWIKPVAPYLWKIPTLWVPHPFSSTAELPGHELPLHAKPRRITRRNEGGLFILQSAQLWSPDQVQKATLATKTEQSWITLSPAKTSTDKQMGSPTPQNKGTTTEPSAKPGQKKPETANMASSQEEWVPLPEPKSSVPTKKAWWESATKFVKIPFKSVTPQIQKPVSIRPSIDTTRSVAQNEAEIYLLKAGLIKNLDKEPKAGVASEAGKVEPMSPKNNETALVELSEKVSITEEKRAMIWQPVRVSANAELSEKTLWTSTSVQMARQRPRSIFSQSVRQLPNRARYQGDDELTIESGALWMTEEKFDEKRRTGLWRLENVMY
jgi:hypothetical protein